VCVCVAVFMTRMFTWPISCARSAVTVAATAETCRMLCSSAYLTTDKLSAVSYDPLPHSRHNDGDMSAKVGHETELL